MAREGGPFGTLAPGLRLDWPAVVARQHEIVRRLGPTPSALERTGARIYLGEARFADAHTLAVNGTHVRGERIVIASGSAPVIPAIAGAALGITSDELLFLPELPTSLVLIGAGAVGLEMASAYRDFGVAVTLVAQEDEILPAFDPDVAGYLRAILEARGITVLRRTRATAIDGRPGDLVTRLTQDGAERQVRAAVVGLTAGRRWQAHPLGAEALGLRTGRLGLETSPDLGTSVAHLWAAGDAAGNVQLTPTAALEGRIAARNALRGERTVPDLTVVPQTIFTTPEIARVGLTHREARERAIECHVSTHDMRGASNGVASGEDGGYLKLVFEGPTERLLGVQMVSYAAGELIQLAALAIRARATAELLASQLSIHPSHGERLIKVAAHDYHDVCEV